jgi:anionic cell wall polymer biosynthesis LytR-Cps2A-Psr (LCP) family protein
MRFTARRVAILVVVLIALLAGGGYAVARSLRNHVDDSIPQGDLFGPSESPTPSAGASPTPSPTPPAGSDIKGPLNFLIVGIDTRESIPGWIPHADAIMIMHVDRTLTHAYLTSLPRDLVVDIPAFAPANFGGAHSKITHAMSYGSRVPGSSRANPIQGFQLVAKAVSGYTGITRFDAGALLTFSGLIKLVNAIGGIDIYVDQKVVSIHKAPSGASRPPCSGCAHGYGGPQATYNVGQMHFVGWQALDYSRQRYTAGGDYTRQRHQRQVIRAIIAKVMKGDVLTNVTHFQSILNALGKSLIFDGRGRKPSEFGYALRNVKAAGMTLVGLPGSGVYSSGGQYLGERLSSVEASYFAAVRSDTLAAWVSTHRNLVNSSRV